MTTAVLEAPPPMLVLDGQLTCDIADCTDIFAHPVDPAHPALSPRKQLQEAATEHGWQQSVAGLNICPRCAAGPLGILIPGWAQALPLPEIDRRDARPPLTGDDVQTLTLPAVVEDDEQDDAPRIHPYKETPR